MIMDNLSTHKSPLIKTWLIRRPRFNVHFTPTYGSWLNMVERWFGLLEQRQLKRGSHRNRRELEHAVREFIDATNEAPKPFVWTKVPTGFSPASPGSPSACWPRMARVSMRISVTGH
jgi:transposase